MNYGLNNIGANSFEFFFKVEYHSFTGRKILFYVCYDFDFKDVVGYVIPGTKSCNSQLREYTTWCERVVNGKCDNSAAEGSYISVTGSVLASSKKFWCESAIPLSQKLDCLTFTK